MLLTRRNILLLSVVSVVILYLYIVELPHGVIPAVPTALKNNIFPLLRQVFSEKFSHRVWTPAIPTSSPSTAAKHQEAKDKSNFEDTRMKFARHIVAVGDLHGDMPNARRVLQFSGVTNDKGDWSGDVDFFVQTGDIIDRCAIWLRVPRSETRVVDSNVSQRR